jgi:hypothetical protein
MSISSPWWVPRAVQRSLYLVPLGYLVLYDYVHVREGAAVYLDELPSTLEAACLFGAVAPVGVLG